jgi:hypothetical protein
MSVWDKPRVIGCAEAYPETVEPCRLPSIGKLCDRLH